MKKRLLIIGFVWPEPDSTAAGSRMMQLIDFFQKNDYKITFVSTAAKSDKSYPLEKRSIVTSEIQLNNTSFDKLLDQIKPTVVLFDRFLTEEQFGWRVSENCPDAIRILDTEDLHFLRYARHLAIKNKEKLSLKHLVNDLFKRELASIYRCDLTLIISKFELELLTKTFKVETSILIYLPFLLPNLDRNMINSYPTFNERSNFISIGNFKHEPNWNAVLYLKNTIWPMIKKELPTAELHIYGAYATEKVNQLHNKRDGFLIKGWAEKAKDVFINAKVCLAPLRFGAGLKGKLIDAMLYGTPSVTTEIGAEAMHDDLPWNGFITDDSEEFTRRAVELYQNENLWLDAQNKGIRIINQCYDKEMFEEKFMESISLLSVNLEHHRIQNTIGILFQHHKLKSTKYLSKWIEEKNKNI